MTAVFQIALAVVASAGQTDAGHAPQAQGGAGAGSAAPSQPVPPSRIPALDALFKVSYELVDEVIATVQKDAITRSDLDRQAAVTIVKTSGPQALASPLDPNTLDFIRRLLINQALILQDVRRQPGAAQRIADDEAREEVKKFAARFPDVATYQQFMAAMDLTEDALKEVLLRDLRVDRFIKPKIKAAAPVPDNELRDFFAANEARFPGKKFEEVADQIRAALTEQRFLENYIKDLRSRYELVEFDRKPATP